MNLFQILTLPLCALLFAWSLIHFLRRARNRRASLMGMLVWFAAGMAIWHPDLTLTVAHALGISRGADLVFYLVAILFFVSVFYGYNEIVHLRSEITLLVRRLALQEAESQLLSARQATSKSPPEGPAGAAK